MDPETERLNVVERHGPSDADSRSTETSALAWRRRSARWLHFASPHPVTVVDLDGTRLQLCRGIRHGRTFVPTHSWSDAGSDPAVRASLLTGLAGRTVHVSVPEALVIRRMFHLPTRDAREIEAILGYQLGPSLPIGLRDLEWSWQILESTGSGSRVLVELVRRDALEHHLTPLAQVGAVVDRAIPEASLLACRVRDLTGNDEASGVFLRPDGVLLVAQREGRFLFASRLLAGGVTAADLEAGTRRTTQQKLESAVERARVEFATHFDRPLPDVAIVVAEPAASPQDHDAEVVLSNALGAQPAGARVHEERLPWRGLTLAALASQAGPSLSSRVPLQRRRTRRVGLHAALLALAAVAALGALGELQLGQLEDTKRVLDQQLAAMAASPVDLAGMQEALRAAELRRAGSYESLYALLTLKRHATSDIVLEDVTYLAGRKVQISGSAQSLTSIVSFAQKLEREALYASAEIQDLQEVVRDEQSRTRFEIEGRLAR